jgi:hypothetical protein
VVQRVGDDGVLGAEERLEKAAVGVEAGGEEDRVVVAEVFGQSRFEATVQVLRAADEADRGHAEAVVVHRLLRGGDQAGIVGEAEVVVGAEVQHLPPGHLHMCALGAGDQAFALHQPVGLDLGEGRGDVAEEGAPIRRTVRHGRILSGLAENGRRGLRVNLTE